MSSRLVTLLCAVAILASAIGFAAKARGPEGLLLDQHGRPQLTDHLSLWAAGRLAAAGQPSDAYDWERHKAEMGRAMNRAVESDLPFSYPPSAMLAFAPLSQLPFITSFLLFGLLTLVPLAIVCAGIIGHRNGAVWMLATVPPFWNFCVGQTGALSGALFGAGLLLLSRRPALAGMMFGLLTFKPHLGLLIPVALLATGQTRAIVAATATAAAMILASALLWGVEPWLTFVHAVSGFGAFAMSAANLTAYKLQSLFGVMRALGSPPEIALTAQVALAIALAALVWHIWRAPGSQDLKSGVLATAAVMATPYAFHYDLVLLTISQAFYLRHALARGITAQDAIVILLVNTVIAIFSPLGFPTGFFASAALLAVLVHRLHSDSSHAAAPASMVRRTLTAPT